MKKILFPFILFLSINAVAQSNSAQRDSVANTTAFQLKVKMATLIAANNLLADTGQPDYVLRYAQVIITEPTGAGWLSALSYGCMTNPAINFDSSDGDIQFTINSIFVKYSKAYYRIIN